MTQTEPNLPPLNGMLCFSIYAAGLAFNRLYRGLLEGFGLTYPQFLVLVALRHDKASTVRALGEKLFLESNTLTPLLKRMEQAGLVTRQRSAKDEREVIVSLTEKGSTLTQELGCVPPQVAEATGWDQENLVALTARINALGAALRQHSAATA